MRHPWSVYRGGACVGVGTVEADTPDDAIKAVLGGQHEGFVPVAEEWYSVRVPGRAASAQGGEFARVAESHACQDGPDAGRQADQAVREAAEAAKRGMIEALGGDQAVRQRLAERDRDDALDAIMNRCGKPKATDLDDQCSPGTCPACGAHGTLEKIVNGAAEKFWHCQKCGQSTLCDATPCRCSPHSRRLMMGHDRVERCLDCGRTTSGCAHKNQATAFHPDGTCEDKCIDCQKVLKRWGARKGPCIHCGLVPPGPYCECNGAVATRVAYRCRHGIHDRLQTSPRDGSSTCLDCGWRSAGSSMRTAQQSPALFHAINERRMGQLRAAKLPEAPHRMPDRSWRDVALQSTVYEWDEQDSYRTRVAVGDQEMALL